MQSPGSRCQCLPAGSGRCVPLFSAKQDCHYIPTPLALCEGHCGKSVDRKLAAKISAEVDGGGRAWLDKSYDGDGGDATYALDTGNLHNAHNPAYGQNGTVGLKSRENSYAAAADQSDDDDNNETKSQTDSGCTGNFPHESVLTIRQGETGPVSRE